MRPAQKSTRSRGRGGRKGTGSNVNRVYESNGPEGKVRGTPQQIYDKYISLARDSQTSGDRVTAENFLQHAEHYQRILTQTMAAQQERREAANGEAQPDPDTAPDDQAQDQGVGEETPARAERRARAPGGMATIDADESEVTDLLVTTEDVESSQPRKRRGNGRVKAETDPREDAPLPDGGSQGD